MNICSQPDTSNSNWKAWTGDIMANISATVQSPFSWLNDRASSSELVEENQKKQHMLFIFKLPLVS